MNLVIFKPAHYAAYYRAFDTHAWRMFIDMGLACWLVGRSVNAAIRVFSLSRIGCTIAHRMERKPFRALLLRCIHTRMQEAFTELG